MKFALAGNPNSGKTTLFNSLTGAAAHVGNWPGVTVDKREGVYKKLEEKVSIIDLPGIYSLSPYTPEEVVSRNFILDEKPDCIIDVIDATNLERNLYLTTQILEIDVPVVIALNMMDVVSSQGRKINISDLEKAFNVKVVQISALKNKGLDELMRVAYSESKKKRSGFSVLNESHISNIINETKLNLSKEGIESPLFHAIKLIENDELEIASHKEIARGVGTIPIGLHRITKREPREDAMTVSQQQTIDAQIAPYGKQSVGVAYMWVGEPQFIVKFNYHRRPYLYIVTCLQIYKIYRTLVRFHSLFSSSNAV